MTENQPRQVLHARRPDAATTWAWIAHDEHRLTLWHFVEGERHMTGMLFLGDIDSDMLRDTRLRGLQLAQGSLLPIWTSTEPQRPPPPSDTQIRKGLAEVVGKRLVRRLRTFKGKGQAESTEDFYRRVAAFYEKAEGDTPVSALATAAGVQRGTASRWVHEARRRGYLPPTTPGKAAR